MSCEALRKVLKGELRAVWVVPSLPPDSSFHSDEKLSYIIFQVIVNEGLKDQWVVSQAIWLHQIFRVNRISDERHLWPDWQDNAP